MHTYEFQEINGFYIVKFVAPGISRDIVLFDNERHAAIYVNYLVAARPQRHLQLGPQHHDIPG